MTEFDLQAYLKERRDLINAELERRLVELPAPLTGLRDAMAYSLMAGGKRLRPILCLAGAELVGGEAESVLPTAAALEYIHTYSLIHDDLPAMDDDDLRRGRPTCHRVYGEAMGVLTGDALLTEAFALLAAQAEASPPERVVEVIAMIAEAAGARGMVGGQVADMAAEGRNDLTLDDVRFIHTRKTSALITVSLAAGASLAGAEDEELEAVKAYGRRVGAAFQIVDDLLDIHGKTDIIGKPVGSDQAKGKATWPALTGVEAARKAVVELIEKGLEAIERFGSRGEPLKALARYIRDRDR